MNGFTELVDAIGSQFSLAKDWLHAVAFPAFEPNMTTIWSLEACE